MRRFVQHRNANALGQCSASRADALQVGAKEVSALYVQGRVHHVGVYLALEDQMVSFTAQRKRDAPSPPARIAALVWALTELVVGNQPQRAKGVWPSRF
jgi:phage terminase large subunit-like protein